MKFKKIEPYIKGSHQCVPQALLCAYEHGHPEILTDLANNHSLTLYKILSITKERGLYPNEVDDLMCNVLGYEKIKPKRSIVDRKFNEPFQHYFLLTHTHFVYVANNTIYDTDYKQNQIAKYLYIKKVRC